MSERVDLDWAEKYLSGRASSGLGRPLGIDATLALVAELRAAREVVETARIDQLQHTCGMPEYHTPGICDLCETMAIYDQVAAP
jgi:hypothetical protein